MTADLQTSIAEAKKVFPLGTPEQQVCEYIFKQLERLHGAFDNVTPYDVANALHWTNDAIKRRAVVSALDFLACGPSAIFERRFELWAPQATGEVLEDPSSTLSDAEMRNALDEEVWTDQESGERIPTALSHVTVRYVVTDLAKKGLPDGLPN